MRERHRQNLDFIVSDWYQTVDSKPRPVIISPPNMLVAADVPINFSQVVTGFTAGGITFTGGGSATLSGSGAVYTAHVTPPGNDFTMQVNAAVGTDSHGLTNYASSVASILGPHPFAVTLTGFYDNGNTSAATTCRFGYVYIAFATTNVVSNTQTEDMGTNCYFSILHSGEVVTSNIDVIRVDKTLVNWSLTQPPNAVNSGNGVVIYRILVRLGNATSSNVYLAAASWTSGGLSPQNVSAVSNTLSLNPTPTYGSTYTSGVALGIFDQYLAIPCFDDPTLLVGTPFTMPPRRLSQFTMSSTPMDGFYPYERPTYPPPYIATQGDNQSIGTGDHWFIFIADQTLPGTLSTSDWSAPSTANYLCIVTKSIYLGPYGVGEAYAVKVNITLAGSTGHGDVFSIAPRYGYVGTNAASVYPLP